MASVEQSRPLREDVRISIGDVKVQEAREPISSSEDVFVLDKDYVKVEYEEARPLRTNEKNGPRWVSPTSILTYKRLKNLYDKGLLGGVEAFLPTPRQLAANHAKGLSMSTRLKSMLKRNARDSTSRKSPIKQLRMGNNLLAKEMLGFHQDHVMAKYNLKFLYTYSRAKSTALKTSNVTSELKKALDEGKNDAEQKGAQLGEVNK
uniref:Uncharacterized protein n=1 Tax=Cannabis sativa TaxID=3483 RepID=A0A803PL52_CANSA